MKIAIFLFCVVILQFNLVFATGTVVINDTVVLAGDSTILHCSGSSINWKHYPLGESDYKIVYIDNDLTKEYSSMGFRIDGNQSIHDRNLFIESVTSGLAGKYVCEDLDTTGNSTQLIVLVDPPKCDVDMKEFIGPNDCNIPVDDVELWCSVVYHGYKPPEIEWRKHGYTIEVLESECTTERNNQIGCKITVKQDVDVALNGSHFVCQTTRRAAAKEQYYCRADFTVLYSFSADESKRTAVAIGDRVECVANSSQACSYKWVWYEKVGNDLSRTIESNDHVLIARKIGLHRCEAQCDLRNQPCLVFPKFVDVIPSQDSLAQSGRHQGMLEEVNEQWTPSVIGLIILGVLPNIVLGCYFFTKIRRKKQRDENHNTTSESNDQTEATELQ